MNTFLKIVGVIADAWNAYKSLRRDNHHDAVDADPESEWMRQFGGSMSRDKADAEQPGVQQATAADDTKPDGRSRASEVRE